MSLKRKEKMAIEKHYSVIINCLKKLKKDYPSMPFHRHLYEATAEYHNNTWLDDKVLSEALQKYMVEVDFHSPIEDTSKLEQDVLTNTANYYHDDEDDEEDCYYLNDDF